MNHNIAGSSAAFFQAAGRPREKFELSRVLARIGDFFSPQRPFQRKEWTMKTVTALIASLALVLIISLPAAAETITIVGTGSGTSILKAIGDAYSEANPGISVDVPKSIGSGGGIKAVGNDEYVIGRVARKVKDKEAHYGLSYIPYAKIPIVFFVNKSAGVNTLRASQVLDIYSGKITNWKEVGGDDARIKVVRREDGDSSLSVLLKTFPGFKDITITSRSKTTYTDPETCQLVESTPGTIAFGTYANTMSLKNVNVVAIDGTFPTDSSYAIVGELGLVFKEQNRNGNIAEFIRFAKSETAAEAIKNAGGMPF
jgi:phosphate transport system substrate-binding protein